MYPPPPPYPAASFNSAHTRARIVKILLIAGAIAAGLSLVTETSSLAFPPLSEDQELGDNPFGIVITLIMFFLALLEGIIYLITVVFFCMWLYRASDNVRAFDPSRPHEYSPGWAVGSFFIPFANLVIPYRAVREVWQKSGPPDEALLSEPSPPASFPIWWAAWLISSIADNISFRASFNDNIPESASTIIAIVASGLGIFAAVFAWLVVDAIDKRQEETSQKLKLGTYAGPPLPSPVDQPRWDVVTAAPTE